MNSKNNQRPLPSWARAIKVQVRFALGTWRSWGKRKIFCIGCNKTGTTSMAKALRELGFVVGLQAPAERLFRNWVRRDYRPIIRYCRTAQAFQDIPFNLPGMYAILDYSFPGSKFILTVRESADAWFESFVRWQAQKFGNGTLPSAEQLKASTYCYPGFAYEIQKYVYLMSDDDLFNRQRLIEQYETYNRVVREYFQRRPEDLLVLNVAEQDAYRRLCEFLGVPLCDRDFPWENRTAPVENK